MQFQIPVFERRTARTLRWITLGLHDHVLDHTGRSALKLHRKLVEDLRALVAKLPQAELEALHVPRGLRIDHVRMELTLHGASQRVKLAGVFPLVVVPRWVSGEHRLNFVYHPLRQHEALPVPDGAVLGDSVKTFFQSAWAELDETALEELRRSSKEAVRLVSFTADPRAAEDLLPERFRVGRASSEGRSTPKKRGIRVLRDIAVDMTSRAAWDNLPAGLPRTALREHLGLLLCGAEKKSCVVVGPHGAGKTTLLHQAVHDLLDADDYPSHRNLDRVHAVWRTSGRRLIAGMSQVGDWEKRCADIVEEARQNKVVLWLEDVYDLGRVGRSRESDRAIGDVLAGAVARGDIVVVGECTASQWQKLEDESPALAARLARVIVPPMSREETFRTLVAEVRRLERDRVMTMGPMVIQSVLDLAGALLSAESFPGAAMGLLQEVASGCEPGPSPREVLTLDVIDAVSRKTGICRDLLRPDAGLGPAELELTLQRQVAGQPEAIAAAVDLVARVQTGLTDNARPWGVYLFTGPTGTGKTELAKCLTELLFNTPVRLVRIDMSEFSTPDAAARLIGDRHEPRGVLTQRVIEQPFCLVLLDEIEKAHRSVLNLLLQLFEDGRLTDAAGNVADFRHAVVVMTSNLGARARTPVGFGADGGVMHDVARAVREYFPPELFNRIDRVVPFRPLDADTAHAIAAKELRKLLARRGLAERSVFISSHPRVVERVVDEAFQARDGARSVKRYLERQVGAAVTAAMAGLEPGAIQMLQLDSGPEGFEVHGQALQEAPALQARWPMEALFHLAPPELMRHLGSVRDFLRELEDSPGLARLSDRIRAHLAEHLRGTDGHADRLYTLDSMRAALVSFTDRLDQILASRTDHYGDADPVIPRGGAVSRPPLFHAAKADGAARAPTRIEMLASIAEGHFLRRALTRVDESDQHGAFVRIRRAGSFSSPGLIRGEPDGLADWLSAAYAAIRGETVDFAAKTPDGRLITGRDVVGPGGLPGHAQEVVLQLAGLCVLDFLAPEHGTHVWQPLTGEPEIVVVEVSAVPVGLGAADWLCSATAGASASASGPGLPPVVRIVRFEPPTRPGGTSPFEVEDYPTSYTGYHHARTLSDGLQPLWLLRLGREDLPAQGG